MQSDPRVVWDFTHRSPSRMRVECSDGSDWEFVYVDPLLRSRCRRPYPFVTPTVKREAWIAFARMVAATGDESGEAGSLDLDRLLKAFQWSDERAEPLTSNLTVVAQGGQSRRTHTDFLVARCPGLPRREFGSVMDFPYSIKALDVVLAYVCVGLSAVKLTDYNVRLEVAEVARKWKMTDLYLKCIH